GSDGCSPTASMNRVARQDTQPAASSHSPPKHSARPGAKRGPAGGTMPGGAALIVSRGRAEGLRQAGAKILTRLFLAPGGRRMPGHGLGSRLAVFLPGALLALTSAVAVAGRSGAPEGQPAARVDYARDVRPLFAARCVACHGAQVQRNGLRLDSPQQAIRG